MAMTIATIMKPVLAARPAANCDTYIVGLLDELRERIDALPVVPGSSVSIPSTVVLELRGAFTEASIAIRNQLKWAQVA
jgi:hypothetical protein